MKNLNSYQIPKLKIKIITYLKKKLQSIKTEKSESKNLNFD